MNHKRRRPGRKRKACDCGGKHAKNHAARSAAAASGSAKRLRQRASEAEAA